MTAAISENKTELTKKMKKIRNKIINSSELVEYRFILCAFDKAYRNNELNEYENKRSKEIISLLRDDVSTYIETYNKAVNELKNQNVELIEKHAILSRLEDKLMNAYHEDISAEDIIIDDFKQSYSGSEHILVLEVYTITAIITAVLTFVGILTENLVKHFSEIVYAVSHIWDSEAANYKISFEMNNYHIFMMLGIFLLGFIAISITAVKQKKKTLTAVGIFSTAMFSVYVILMIVYHDYDFTKTFGLFTNLYNTIIATLVASLVLFIDFKRIFEKSQRNIDDRTTKFSITSAKALSILGIFVFCICCQFPYTFEIIIKCLMLSLISFPTVIRAIEAMD